MVFFSLHWCTHVHHTTMSYKHCPSHTSSLFWLFSVCCGLIMSFWETITPSTVRGSSLQLYIKFLTRHKLHHWWTRHYCHCSRLGATWIRIHFWMTTGCLLVIIGPALTRLNSSMMCRYLRYLPNSGRSTATVSVKSVASRKPTTGVGTGFLNLKHVSQLPTSSVRASKTSVLCAPAIFSNFLSQWADVCPNWLKFKQYFFYSSLLELLLFNQTSFFCLSWLS